MLKSTEQESYIMIKVFSQFWINPIHIYFDTTTRLNSQNINSESLRVTYTDDMELDNITGNLY